MAVLPQNPLARINGRVLAVAAAALLLTATFFVFTSRGPEMRTVAAHFPRAVSIYPGTDVRILGVNVGRVTAVIPEGNSVRVEMEYDGQYKVPADAKAVIVTPTLVADRFVQLTPAYDGHGRVMADGADIALPDTAVPVELDRIYASLRDLSVALGRTGVNKDGTLDHLLRASARALDGNGELGHEMLTQLAAATETFGKGSDNLFATVDQLATFTQELGANDRMVRAFIKDLAGMSHALVSERVELQRAVGAVARAVGSVEGFVKDNRHAIVTDVEKLTRVMTTINSERDSIDRALHAAPLALGNLAIAFNNETGSIGSRVGVQGTFGNPAIFLCAVVQQQENMPKGDRDTACKIFDQLFAPYTKNQQSSAQVARQAAAYTRTHLDRGATEVPAQYADNGSGSFSDLVGGGA